MLKGRKCNIYSRGLIILQFDPKRPSLSWVYSKPSRVIAFGFGSGVIHPGPGTWGTLLAWLIWLLFLGHLSTNILLVLLLLAFIAGCVVAHSCGEELGIADHGGINWDEMVAVWLVLLLIPVGIWYQFAAVVLFRFFDILKPPPISTLDSHFKNGFGVMIDDILAGIYTLIVIYLFALFIA